ncbi:MAG: non-ribosomal peptide synthetase [Clostridia bacterium]|nr:non-ribosomal peptide synthetase [Clostridia bacterium]
MKLDNINGFKRINDYINDKIHRFEKEQKNCESLFRYMFSERDNVMSERTEGYSIVKTTYGQCYNEILSLIPRFKCALSSVPKNGIVGLDMANSLDWIIAFWCILASGYRPLLVNSRLGKSAIEKVLVTYNITAVISDGQSYSVNTLFYEDICTSKSAQTDESVFADEVLFMSSGTSDNVKLCVFTGENLFYQVRDSANIIKACPKMKEHYEGQLKHLVLLPLYHVFGFIAIYVWFGFFSRTFVFPENHTPSTVLTTVRKHKVTHIFAVPLVWDTVHRNALAKIKAHGQKTYEKFCKGVKLASTPLGRTLTKNAFSQVRDNLFGDSIRFMISGGSHIKSETLEFFNAIGYHIANGFGMTEIGITSVETSDKAKVLNGASIGSPFAYTQYSVADDGELLVKGKTRASAIMKEGRIFPSDYEQWFHTNDLVKVVDGRYYIVGRKDDLIACENGENLNPTLRESELNITGADGVCIFSCDGAPTLLISAPRCYTSENLTAIFNSTNDELTRLNLNGTIKKIVVTSDSLLTHDEFKISRKRIADRYEANKYNILTLDANSNEMLGTWSQLEGDVRACFAQALNIDENEIKLNDNFFTDLGGNSLSYFTLCDLIKEKMDVALPMTDGKSYATVSDVCAYIKNL